MQRSHHYRSSIGPRQSAYPKPVRNPWVDRHIESSSSSASPSGHSSRPLPQHHVVAGPPPVSEWLRPPRNQTVVAAPAVARGLSIHSSSPGASATGAAGSTDSCGGQCAGCDAFFYHCLQVVYIAGILTGISLTIAGSVLRGNPRKGDLLVLVYIGILLAAVCAVLLSVHYCVRRNIKERKRALRLSRVQPRPPPTPTEPSVTIYMQDLPTQEPEPDFRHPYSLPRRGSSRSRSTNSHPRRYYGPDIIDRPLEDWERQPHHQPLIHRQPQ